MRGDRLSLLGAHDPLMLVEGRHQPSVLPARPQIRGHTHTAGLRIAEPSERPEHHGCHDAQGPHYCSPILHFSSPPMEMKSPGRTSNPQGSPPTVPVSWLVPPESFPLIPQGWVAPKAKSLENAAPSTTVRSMVSFPQRFKCIRSRMHSPLQCKPRH